jgi:3-oxoacyl-[acyl-carrier protein] reductase
VFDLSGQTALITGGAQGLGLGIATQFACSGSRVILADRSLEKAQRSAAQLTAMGHDAIANSRRRHEVELRSDLR